MFTEQNGVQRRCLQACVVCAIVGCLIIFFGTLRSLLNMQGGRTQATSSFSKLPRVAQDLPTANDDACYSSKAMTNKQLINLYQLLQ